MEGQKFKRGVWNLEVKKDISERFHNGIFLLSCVEPGKLFTESIMNHVILTKKD